MYIYPSEFGVFTGSIFWDKSGKSSAPLPSQAISRDASPQSTAQLCKDRESRESNTSASPGCQNSHNKSSSMFNV